MLLAQASSQEFGIKTYEQHIHDAEIAQIKAQKEYYGKSYPNKFY